MSENLNEILAAFDKRGVENIRLGGIDIDGIMRGKYISKEKFGSAAKSGMGFCDVIFGWDSADELYDNVTYTGWHTGYPDVDTRIELDTLRWVPWEDNTPFFLLDFYDADGGPCSVSPRQVLRHITARAHGLGYLPKFAAEYEFFLFDETPHSLHEKNFKDLQPLSPGMFGYSSLRLSAASDFVRAVLRDMRAFDVTLEGFHPETGPGVYEAAVGYDEIVSAADKAALFKQGFKEICQRNELTVSFMAKTFQHLPGSSGHTHQSLWDPQGQTNLFFDGDNPHKMSDTFRWYMGGLCKHLPDLTAMFCPTINSYKRLVPGMWAPTHMTWGFDNRTCALRIITGASGSSTRVENRLIGADANPYLAFAASLAAGLDGIENKIEPPDAIQGNAYDVAPDESVLPRSLEEASLRFSKSDMARKWFGDLFVDHYAASRDWEVREFRKAVTDWEHNRYMEII
jgi:glutamine synthetase